MSCIVSLHIRYEITLQYHIKEVNIQYGTVVKVH